MIRFNGKKIQKSIRLVFFKACEGVLKIKLHFVFCFSLKINWLCFVDAVENGQEREKAKDITRKRGTEREKDEQESE